MQSLEIIDPNKIVLMVVSAFFGVLLKYLFDEFTRARKKRKIVTEQFMPSLEFSFKKDRITARLVGDYEITNLSDLPVRIQRPHLLGYNLANRAFQFKVRSHVEDFRSFLEPVKIPKDGEYTLISADKCHIEIERFEVDPIPTYIWLETLEYMRLASNRKQRWIAHLYRLKFFDQKEARAWYEPTGKNIVRRHRDSLPFLGNCFIKERNAEGWQQKHRKFLTRHAPDRAKSGRRMMPDALEAQGSNVRPVCN